MKKSFFAPRASVWAALLLLVAGLAFSSAHGNEDGAAADSVGALHVQADEYELDTASGWARAEGGVRIAYRGMALEADRLRLNVQTKDVEASGNIYLYSLAEPGLTPADRTFFWRGEDIQGNFDTREFRTGSATGQFDEWFAVSGTSEFSQTGDVVFKNVKLSTCDYLCDNHAHYHLAAREVVYRTEDGRLFARHAVFKIANIPVFYWPYVVWDTRSDGGNVNYRIGYRDDWGAFLTVGRRWNISERADTEFSLDLMAKRGVGIGNLTRVQTDRTTTELHLYGVADSDPPEDEQGMNRRFDSTGERFRTKLYHVARPREKLTLRLHVDKLSDIDMLEEWYKREFRDYRQPESFADLRYESERFTLSLAAKFRVNDFYTVSEKLPELRLDVPRRQLFDSPLYYHGATSLSYLRMRWRSFDQDEWWPTFPVDLTDYYNQPNTYDTWRLDTIQMLYLPWTLGNFLNLVPRAGFRLTYYADTSDRDVTDEELETMFRFDDPDLDLPVNNVSLYDSEGGDTWRFAPEVGLEMSTKLTRVWDDARSDFWRVDGLRHIVQPYLNYTYVGKPNISRENLFYFDETDRLRGENFLRFGAEQRLQTRREIDGGNRVYTLARVDSYADIHLDKADGRKHPGDFVTRLRFDPKPNVSFWGTFLLDMNSGVLRRSEIGATLGDPDRLALNLAYIIRDDESRPPITTFGGTTTDYTGDNITSGDVDETHAIVTSLNVRINDKTSGVATAHYDVERNRLARQIYQLNRDLHCWRGGFFIGEDYGDFLIGVALTLSAFPEIGIEIDIY